MTTYKYICEDCGRVFYSEGRERKTCPNCKSKDLGLILTIDEERGSVMVY